MDVKKKIELLLERCQDEKLLRLILLLLSMEA